MKINKSEKIKEKTTSKEKNTNMLLAAFILFIFPIICVFIGVFLGEYIGKFIGAPIQASQIVGGIIAFVLSFVLMKLFDKSTVVDAEEEKIKWGHL